MLHVYERMLSCVYKVLLLSLPLYYNDLFLIGIVFYISAKYFSYAREITTAIKIVRAIGTICKAHHYLILI